jgi:hypothetical protein
MHCCIRRHAGDLRTAARSNGFLGNVPAALGQLRRRARAPLRVAAQGMGGRNTVWRERAGGSSSVRSLIAVISAARACGSCRSGVAAEEGHSQWHASVKQQDSSSPESPSAGAGALVLSSWQSVCDMARAAENDPSTLLKISSRVNVSRARLRNFMFSVPECSILECAGSAEISILHGTAADL